MGEVPNLKRKFNGKIYTLGLESPTKAGAVKMRDGWKGLGWKARITTHKGKYKYRVWYRKEVY